MAATGVIILAVMVVVAILLLRNNASGNPILEEILAQTESEKLKHIRTVFMDGGAGSQKLIKGKSFFYTLTTRHRKNLPVHQELTIDFRRYFYWQGRTVLAAVFENGYVTAGEMFGAQGYVDWTTKGVSYADQVYLLRILSAVEHAKDDPRVISHATAYLEQGTNK